MCERRSITSTRASSSRAACSATVRPKKPAPTISRSGSVISSRSDRAHRGDRFRDRTVEQDLVLVDDDPALAVFLDSVKRMADHEDRLPGRLEFADLREALLLE